jgi:hypothetical protein
MATWTVLTNDGDDDGLLASVQSNADGTVSLHVPSPDPVVLTTTKAEEIRLAMGAAIGDARAQAGPQGS